MARKLDAEEPLLTAVARKLGRAAGTLVNMTQMLSAEQTTPESNSMSERESSKSEPPNKKKISATVGQNRSKKQRNANPKKRTAKAHKASARNTITSKRGSNRKR
jgi:hypothetical protein